MNAIEMLANANLPPVAGPAETADLLVAITHRAVPDKRRFGKRYWDALAERVRAGCYVGPTLRQWWRRVTTDLGIDSAWPDDQHLLATLLDGGDDTAVLRVLREETATVALRVRLAADVAKANRINHTEEDLV